MSLADVLADVRRAERTGDYLAAFDLASRALDAHPDAPATGDGLALRHRAVLALARSGATRRARALFTALGLDGHADPEIAALAARLAKDEALAATGEARARLARAAADRYAAVYATAGGHYPAVNAATMYRIAGDRARSDELARAALAAAEADARADGLDAYWAASSAIEAHLLLGDMDRARLAMYRAAELNPHDHAARATTLRQLVVLGELLGFERAWLGVLAPPTVIHYTGHRISPAGQPGRFPAEREAEVAADIDKKLAMVGYGFGALAAGADILVAEALLARGAELHVVLPCGEAEFVHRSVHVGGADDARWAARFKACLARATSVVFATPDEVGVDDELFRYASRLAMGLALLRARHLMTGADQLAVWDGQPTALRAGTAPDVAAWRERGHFTHVVDPLGNVQRPPAPASVTLLAEPAGVRRVRAMLFGDIKGFSKLAEDQVPTFVDGVLGAFGRVLDEFGAAIEERNTWGDGIYIVVRDTATAARVALALQRALERVDLAALGLPPHLALRLAGHVGPVYALADAVARRASHFGTHVTRTARIEPVTPEGEVFVTEAFAAALALDDPGFRCEYVGHMPAAKGFGAMRMHSLLRGTLEAP